MPSSLWEFNLSGCFFLVLSKLLICLKSGVIPYYIIQEKNLFYHFFQLFTDINTLCVCVESIRVFPVHITQFLIKKKTWICVWIKFSPINFERYTIICQNERNRPVVSNGIPLMYQTAWFLSSLGYYQTTCKLLESIYKLTTFSSRNREQGSCFFTF